MMKSEWGNISRLLFEEAALAHHEDDPGTAGNRLGEALTILHSWLGISSTPDSVLDEAERWFSFFDWWYASGLLNRGESSRAWSILIDLAESFGPQRSVELGIEADYGAVKVGVLYSKTMMALGHIQNGELAEAAKCALEAADIQYGLAVERTGTPQPCAAGR